MNQILFADNRKVAYQEEYLYQYMDGLKKDNQVSSIQCYGSNIIRRFNSALPLHLVLFFLYIVL